MRFRTLIFAATLLIWAVLPALAAEPDPRPSPLGKEGLQPIELSPAAEEFHPVKKPLESMQYFPDEVERMVEQAIIAGYIGRSRSIDRYYRRMMRRDLKLINSKQAPTGLADNMLQFRNSHITDPKAYREAQQQALKQKGLSKELKQVIAYRIKNAELARAERLLEEDQLVKIGLVVNGFLRSLDLLGLTMGSVVGSTVDAAVRTFVNLEEIRKMSVREKKALAEYQAYLAKHPDAPDADEVRAKIQHLEEKKLRWALREEVDKAEELLEAHDYLEAQKAYSRALEMEPAFPDALEGLKRVEKLRAEYETAMDRSLTVKQRQAVPLESEEEEEVYRRLLIAVAAGDHAEVERLGGIYIERFPKSPYRDEAAYALASTVALSGDIEKGKQLLRNIAQDYKGENMARRARLVLSSQEFDRLGAFYAAKHEHTRKQVQYALLGEDLARQNADLGVYRLFIEGIKSVETLGMINLLGATMRTVTVVSHDPIPNEPIIDEGLRFSRSNPDAPEVKEVYYQIGKAYEREHKYIDALLYYQLSGRASERKINSLRGRSARNLMAQATMVPDPLMKARLYRAIIEQLPETKEVAKAKVLLVTLAQKYEDRFRLSREYLLDHPETIGPQGLNLDSRLFDGDRSNPELHEKGIVLLRGNRMKVFFTMPDESESSQVFRLDPEMVVRFEGLMRDLDRKRAYALSKKYGVEGPIVATSKSFGGTVAEQKRYNPFIVREVNEITGNVYLSEEELGQYEETIYANLGADVSPDLGDLSTGGALYLRRYGAGVNFGVDQESPNVGALVPLGIVDINTKVRATGLSVYPSIRFDTKPVPDAHLYK